MSFQAQFAEMDQELKDMMNEYSKKVEQLPNELEKLMEANEKKLELFIQNFQNQVITLKKAQQRDCKLIDNLKYQIQQRRSQNELVENATKMQEILSEKLKQNIQNMQEIIQEIDEKIVKHQENLNRTQIDLDNIENINRNKGGGNQVQLNKQSNKFFIKIEKNGARTYQISYSEREDKFGVSSADKNDKNVLSVVGQFNFHRNLKRLYTDLYRVS